MSGKKRPVYREFFIEEDDGPPVVRGVFNPPKPKKKKRGNAQTPPEGCVPPVEHSCGYAETDDDMTFLLDDESFVWSLENCELDL